ncbi:MAG: metallophosphoesterase [Deltaproteobacteria bacterium]|nr:metallophosphoesterase [Deltaproteobacteria bacterium]
MKYHRFLIPVIACLALFLFAKAYYDTYTLEVRHYRIVHNRLAEALGGAKVAFLSDLHMRRFGPREQEIIRILQEEKPDIILLGGDYISFRGSYDPVMAFFNQLPRAYAVMGNSDYYNENGSCVLCHKPDSYELKSDQNVFFLRNASALLNTAGVRVNLIGLDDPVNKKGNIAEATRGIEPSFPSVLLAHSPDVFEEASARGIDFVLAGHNHGGQVFPARYLKGRMLVDPAFEYLDGFFQKGRTLMYVGRGVGTSYFPFRLGVRPEVTFFQFIHETGDGANPSQAVSPVSEMRRTVLFSFENLTDLMGLSNELPGSGQKKYIVGPSGKLFDFESETELDYLNWECHKWFERTRDHATSGEYSLKVALPAGQYPGINFLEVEKDWSAYRQLRMEVFNPDIEPLKFHVRIDDRSSRWDYGERFDRDFTIKRGMANITIPLDSLKANVSQRSLDLRNIKHLMFFIPGNERQRTFYIDNIRLE